MGTSGNQLALLQMLMPIVRPDGIASTRQNQNLPLEDQTFEQMLAGLQNTQALAVDAGDDVLLDDAQQNPAPMQMLTQLGGMDRIENATLRNLLAQQPVGSGEAQSMQ